MLNDTQMAHYRDKGWVVVPGLFDPAACEAIAQLASDLGVADLSEAKSGYGADKGPDGTLAPRKLDAPFKRDARFRDFALGRPMRSILRQLMGVEPLLATDQIFLKPPRVGGPKPWHQDNAYFFCEPRDQAVTAWIALDDVDVANGCLYYLNGSHKLDVIPHQPIPGQAYNLVPRDWHQLRDLQQEPAPVPKGGVVFHHSHALHRSPPNSSDRWRRGYATHWVGRAVVSQVHIVKNAYFNNPEYAPLFAALSPA